MKDLKTIISPQSVFEGQSFQKTNQEMIQKGRNSGYVLLAQQREV